MFLASDEPEWVTGDVIKASGGGEVELRVGRDLPRARRSTRQGQRAERHSVVPEYLSINLVQQEVMATAAHNRSYVRR